MPKNRKIKISKSFRSSKFNPYQPIASTSKIILMGNWLEKAGFIAGQSVNVSVKEKMLTISIN